MDLRTDTSSLSAQQALESAAEAALGNDDFGEDPTVNKLESVCAEMCGKEAALFTPSGSMSNQIALMSHLETGDAFLVGRTSHIILFELGASARLGGFLSITLDDKYGYPDLSQCQNQLVQNTNTPIKLLCLENTHNAAGGLPLTAEKLQEYLALADRFNLKIHVDGARVLHAAQALGVKPDVLLKGVDSVSICMSKALGAPAGSILSGSRDFIARARKNRKLLGGGMRKPGFLAAVCLHTLNNWKDIIGRDHAVTKKLAERLSAIEHIFFASPPLTNIIMLDTSKTNYGAVALAKILEAEGLLTSPFTDVNLRLIVHSGVNENDIEKIAVLLEKALV